MAKKTKKQKEPKYNCIEHLGPRLHAIEQLETMEIPFWIRRHLPQLQITGPHLSLAWDGDLLTRREAIAFFEQMIETLQVD
jgi:hypothetical protein